MVSRLERFGVALAPNSATTSLLTGLLNAWSYNYRDPINQLRDKSIQLRNAVDDVLAKYSAQLRDELSKLRKALPEPTRDNPFPPRDAFDAVKELDAYIREVEAVRIRIRSAAVPPNDIVWHGRGDNQVFFSNLESVDVELMTVVSQLSEDSIAMLKQILDHRDDLVRGFLVS